MLGLIKNSDPYGGPRFDAYIGSAEIEVTDLGYIVSIYKDQFFSDLQGRYQIKTNEKYQNCFGFLSQHYIHNCNFRGRFELSNIKVYYDSENN